MTLRGLLSPFLLALAGASLACTLTFSEGLLQSLRIAFELDSSLPAREATVVQTLVTPERVTLQRRFLGVAGALEAAAGTGLPRRLELRAESVDLATGRRLFALNLTLRVRPDGTFSATRRLKRNLEASSMTTVAVEPVGGDLAAGTRVSLCVDVVRRRADLAASPCPVGGAPGPSTFAEIQSGIFTPTCTRGGCHDSATSSAGLSLEAGESYGELVGVPSNQVPFRLRVAPGNSDDSYLMMKLRGSAGIQGVRMPLDGPPFLSAAQVAGIARWIDAGAPES